MSLKILIALFVTTLYLPAITEAAKLYKWVDEEGHTHYSDKIPPSQTGRARSTLDSGGVTIDRLDAEKTTEQRRREAEEQRLRREQERLAQKQRQSDRVLLRTFRTEEDIIMTRDGQVQAVDTYIRVTQSNIKRLKKTLAEMQKNAAELELSGQNISKRYLNDIEEKRQALKDSYQSIIDREHEKNRIRQTFARDLNRFRELKKLAQINNPMQEADKSYTDALLNVFNCGQDLTCDGPWQRARAYLREHSTTQVKMDGENILMTAAPPENDDISITVSRINDQKSGQTLIFMDLQCKETSMGEALCARGERVRRIKRGFQEALAQGSPTTANPTSVEIATPAR